MCLLTCGNAKRVVLVDSIVCALGQHWATAGTARSEPRVLGIAPQLELGIRREHVVRLFLGHAASVPAKICQARADLAVRLSTM